MAAVGMPVTRHPHTDPASAANTLGSYLGFWRHNGVQVVDEGFGQVEDIVSPIRRDLCTTSQKFSSMTNFF